MIRWPWTSRARLEDALEQVAHLRAECAKLTEALTRIGRREVGLPEVPRGARVEIGEPPAKLARYIAGFENRSIRTAMWSEARQRRRQGTSWEEIESDVMEGASEQQAARS